MDMMFTFLDNTTFEVEYDELVSVIEYSSYYLLRYTDGSAVHLLKSSLKNVYVEDYDIFATNYYQGGN